MDDIITRITRSSNSSATPSQPAEPPTHFHLFKKLPTAMRLAIWTLALPEPRILEILFKKDRADQDIIDQGPAGWVTHSRTPTPSILHACAESRSLGLKFYDKLMVIGRFKRTYVRWDRDIVYVDLRIRRRAGIGDYYYDALVGSEESDFKRHCKKVVLKGWEKVERRPSIASHCLFRTFPKVNEFGFLEEGGLFSSRVYTLGYPEQAFYVPGASCACGFYEAQNDILKRIPITNR